jgi:hypothetical protein
MQISLRPGQLVTIEKDCCSSGLFARFGVPALSNNHSLLCTASNRDLTRSASCSNIGGQENSYIVLEDLDVRELRDRVGIDGNLDGFAGRVKSRALLKVRRELELVIVSAAS